MKEYLDLNRVWNHTLNMKSCVNLLLKENDEQKRVLLKNAFDDSMNEASEEIKNLISMIPKKMNMINRIKYILFDL